MRKESQRDLGKAIRVNDLVSIGQPGSGYQLVNIFHRRLDSDSTSRSGREETMRRDDAECPFALTARAHYATTPHTVLLFSDGFNVNLSDWHFLKQQVTDLLNGHFRPRVGHANAVVVELPQKGRDSQVRRCHVDSSP